MLVSKGIDVLEDFRESTLVKEQFRTVQKLWQTPGNLGS